ncbi:MAG: hypothetical protein K8T90_01205 [Planctomycetes bacterium]|nr:hypothetical protein [Planctomycetota bacterium]
MVTPPRRRAIVVAGLVLAVAAAVAVAVRWSKLGVIRSAGWGDVLEFQVLEAVSPRVPWLRLPRTQRVLVKRGHGGPTETVLWVVVDRPAAPANAPCARLVAECGCRIVGAWVPMNDWMGAVWQPFPSLGPSATIAVEVDGREHLVTVERPSPVPARVASPDRPVLPLPWSGEVLGERIELRESEGSVLVRWRPVGESPSPMARDYDGRMTRVPWKTPTNEGWADLQFGTLLCPHGPWWEIEFANPGGEPTVLRFACPKAAATPATSK